MNRGLYPDVFVSCDEDTSGDDAFATVVPLIVEVLSPSTEAHDRGDKFAFYRELRSLQEYVLVDSKAVSIDVFRRREPGVWEVSRLGMADELLLTSVGLELSVSALYDGVQLSTSSGS